jgi:hypothetical protein
VFFVNAKRLDGLQSLPMFKSYIDAELRSPHPTSTSAMSSGQTSTTLP